MLNAAQMIETHLKSHTGEPNSMFETWKLWVWNLETMYEVLRQVIQVLKPENKERNNKL